MKEPTHTPGPWISQSDETPWTEGDATIALEHGEPPGPTIILFSVQNVDGDVVAYLPWEPGSDESRQAELRANARLIAAAPDLLAALEDLVRAFEKLPQGNYHGFDRARAVLAKAKEPDHA